MLVAHVRKAMVIVSVLAAGCGEETPPAPAAVPEEFDDPFADEVKPEPEAAPKIALVEPAVAEAVAEPVVEPVAPDGANSPAVVEEVEAGKGEPVARKAKAVPAVPKDRPPVEDKPVPADMPAPAPAPAPVPVPVPVPATEPVAAPVAPPQPGQARFAGTFRYAGGQAQRDNLAAAIEAAAMEMNALIRGIARKRLTEANPVREQMSFVVEGTKVTATFAAGRTITGTIGGPKVAWTSDSGKPLTVMFSLVKGRLIMDFKAEDGGRRSTFTLDESGDKLTMSVTVTSERLTNPLKYALTYRRS